MINDGANKAVDTLYTMYVVNTTRVSEHDIIFISNVLNGLLVDYDSISPDRTNKLMDLISAIGNAPAYFVPKYANDRKIVLDAINRYGARLVTHIKIHFRKTDFEHSPNIHGIQRDDLIQADLNNLQNLYLKFRIALQSFIDKSSLRLNQGENRFIYTSFNFDLSLQHGYPNNFVGRDTNIQSNDAFWT